MTSAINRRQLLRDAARGAIGTTAAVGLMSSGVFAEQQRGPEESEHVEGGWYITVEVTQPSPAMFDALYGFGKGGEFTRIDGRNNAPAIGTWTRTEDGSIVFSAILFNFVNGVRTGYISGKFTARLIDGTMTGTFTAEGHGIPGFLPRSGNFTGTRIVPEAP
jgi:hypothetical protein